MNHPAKIGKYSIEKILGRGGMGIVYQGYDAALQRHAAVKVISSGLPGDQMLRRLFVREARAVAQIDHPNVVTIYDLDEDVPFIAMAYLEGEDLKVLIEDEKQRKKPTLIPFAKKLDIAAQICLGLHVAHQHAVIHRDVKPGNVRITLDGTAKLLDFGLAHLGTSDETLIGKLVGTVAYMSPEQASTSMHIDHRSDVFSLGVLFYELLSYRRPFEGDGWMEICRKITSQPHTPLSEVLPGFPVELDRIVNKALAKNPDERYSSCKDFADALQQFRQILPEIHRELLSRSAAARSDFQLNKHESEGSKGLDFLDGFLLDSDVVSDGFIERPEFDFGPLDQENDLGCLLLHQAKVRNHLDPAVRKLEQASWLVEAFDLAHQAFQIADLEECLKQLDRIIKIYPWSSKALQMQAECRRLLQGSYEDLFKEELERAQTFEAAGDLHESFLAATRALRYKAEDPGALDLQQRAKEILDRKQKIRVLLAEAHRHFKKRRFEACLQATEEACLLEPGHEEIADLRARAQREIEIIQQMAEAKRRFQEGRITAALRILPAILERAPTHPEAQALKEDASRILKVRHRRTLRAALAAAALLAVIGAMVWWGPRFPLTRSATGAGSGVQTSADQPGASPSADADLTLSKNAETHMNEGKRQADEAKAPELVPTSYQRAQDLENQARVMVQDGRHGASAQKFYEARGQYVHAAEEAKTAGRRRQQILDQQRAEIQKMEQAYLTEQAAADQLGVPDLFPAQYQKATAAATEAQAKARQLDFPGAQTKFEAARKILEESVNEARKIQLRRDSQAIRQLMDQYLAALNNRSLSALSRVWPNPAEAVMVRLRRDFSAQSLQVSLDCPGSPSITKDHATLTCTQSSKQIENADAVKRTFNTNPTFNLRRNADGWIIVGMIE